MGYLKAIMVLGVVIIGLIALARYKSSDTTIDECTYTANAPANAVLIAIANVTAAGIVMSDSEGVAASEHTLASKTIAFHLSFRKQKDGSKLLVVNSGGLVVGFVGRTGQFCALGPGGSTYFSGAKNGLKLYHLP